MSPLVLTHASARSKVAVKFVPPGVRTVSARACVHPLAELLAEAIDLTVIGPHALAHDPRRDANHVRVPDAAPLDDADDRHARRQLPFLRLDAQDARIRSVERVEHLGRRRRSSAAATTDSIRRQCASAPASASACSRLAATSRLASSATSATCSPRRIARHVLTALCAPGSRSASAGPKIIAMINS